jgi:secreted protein with Ig-like and vWFA domain
MNSHSPEDRLLDELLREQAKGPDEDFLKQIEAAVDAGPPRKVKHPTPFGYGRIAIAASIGLVAGITASSFFLNHQSKPALAATEKNPAEELAARQAKAASAAYELEKAIRNQEDLVEERGKVLASIARVKDQDNLYGSYNEIERTKLQLESQITSMLRYDAEQLFVYAAGIDLPNNIVKKIYPKYLEAQRTLETLKAQKTKADDPAVTIAVEQLSALKQQMDAGIVQIRAELQSQLDVATSQFKNVVAKADTSREESIKRGLDAQDYGDAKREFESNQQLLSAMKLKRIELATNGIGEPTDSFADLAANEVSSLRDSSPSSEGKGMGAGSGLGLGGSQTPKLPSQEIKPPTEPTSADRYGRFIDQPWKSPTRDPLSTFSIDVDTASYSNVRRMIQEGREIPRDAVRIEECINAFSYHYQQPKGDAPFAVSAALAACPWAPMHQLVRVAIQGREIDKNKRPPSNLVFLVDVSGSMQSSDKLPLLKQSMTTLVEQLDDRDRVAIVVYAGSEGVVLPSTRLNSEGRATVLKSLASLEAGGSTNGGAGIKRAYELAMKEKIDGGVNRVILASDGDFNVGVTGQQELVELVKERAQGGIYLTVLGFGTGNLNDAMMDAITRDGNGNYFYIDSPREGQKVFLEKLSGTLVTIAKDVKIQVEFNPVKVGTYRLIGYSNRVLQNEDFSNDKVDAGDIGAGHSVTAFYELTPPGEASNIDGLKYQPAPSKTEAANEWLTVKLRHKHPDGNESRLIEFPLTGEPLALDKTGADFQFATAAALFGMKLRGMDEVNDIGWEKVLELAKPGLAEDSSEDRAEFIELVKKLTANSQRSAPAAEVVPNNDETKAK